MNFQFSQKLIEEIRLCFKQEYGFLMSNAEAQSTLHTLTSSMFPIDMTVAHTESSGGAKEGVQPTCTVSLSAVIQTTGSNKVGASITPTLGQEK